MKGEAFTMLNKTSATVNGFSWLENGEGKKVTGDAAFTIPPAESVTFFRGPLPDHRITLVISNGEIS